MSEEKPNVPKLRFPGFADPWEQRKFSEIATLRRGLTYSPNDITDKNGGIRVLRSSNISGDQFELHDDDVFVREDAVKIAPAEDGDILITAANGSSNLVGKRARICNLPGKTVHGGFMLLASTGDSYYLNAAMGAQWYRRFLHMGVAGGNGALGNLDMKALLDYELLTPSRNERKKIGSLFNRLDSLITLHQRKLDHLKEMKKGLLQKMFPKNGESIPELRFPGFADPWEQRKALHLASYSKGKGYSKDDLTESGTPVILYGRLYTKYESVIEEVDTFVDASNDGIYSHGDEVIVPASGETAEDIARASAVAQPGVLLGGDLNILRPNKSITSLFMALSLSNGTAQKELSKRAQGKSVVHVHNSDIQDVTISYPTIDEQTQIGAFFRSLDSLITLHQRKLDHLKQMKKGLLQQMFV